MPISDCEVRDPRIRRTRQLLQGALQTLLQTKSLEEISVQDIAETATVNRATFYDHYTDKFSLFKAIIGGGFHQLLRDREVRFDSTSSKSTGEIIRALCDYLTQTHSGGSCERHSAFQPFMDAAVVEAVQRVILSGLPAAKTGNPLPPAMIASSASGAIYGAVKEWFYTPEHPPVDAILPSILKLALPILEVGAEIKQRG